MGDHAVALFSANATVSYPKMTDIDYKMVNGSVEHPPYFNDEHPEAPEVMLRFPDRMDVTRYRKSEEKLSKQRVAYVDLHNLYDVYMYRHTPDRGKYEDSDRWCLKKSMTEIESNSTMLGTVLAIVGWEFGHRIHPIIRATGEVPEVTQI